MEAKLINLNVYDARNVICVWNEKNQYDSADCGIACDDALVGFLVPKYIVVGVFDDGTTKVAGISSYMDIANLQGSGNGIFLYDEIEDYVSLFMVKAILRNAMGNGDYNNERIAAMEILHELESSGVTMEHQATIYLRQKATKKDGKEEI